MSHSKLLQYKLIFCGLSLGVAAIAVNPTIAQAEAPESTGVSTQADDLLLPGNEQPKYFIDLKQVTYQARELDLEKFCQNYPYNSKCAGVNTPTPGVETDEDAPGESMENEDNDLQSSSKSKSGWAIAPEISTLGLGGHVIRRITPNLNARVGINAFGAGFEIEDDDNSATYDVDLNLLNVSTLADYHPFKSSGFKMTGGLVFNDNNIEGSATSDGDQVFEIGDQEFSTSEVGSVDTNIEVTRSVAPYLGIGWGNPVRESKGLGFWFNLGVMLGGSPNIEVTPNINENLPDEQRQEIEDRVNAEIEKEEEEIEDDLAVVGVYPVGTIGLSYQF
jgi:hypothetical protein